MTFIVPTFTCKLYRWQRKSKFRVRPGARVSESQNTQRQGTKKKNREKGENGKRTSLSVTVCVVCDLQS